MKGFSALAIAGAVLLLLGIVGTAIPVFFTQETHEAFRLGNLFSVQVTENRAHVVPPIVSTAALILGALLLAMGFFRKSA